MDTFFQQVINGLSLGAIYALIALGYTMVYGILKLINFAHGEVFMVGAYAGFFSASALGIEAYESSGAAFPLYLAIVVLVLAMACAALLGTTIELLAYRPVRSAPRLTPLITAIGVSLFLQNVAMLLFSPNPRRYPSILPCRSSVSASYSTMKRPPYPPLAHSSGATRARPVPHPSRRRVRSPGRFARSTNVPSAC